MPDLLDVEVYRARVEKGALNRVVETVSFRPEGTETEVSGTTLREALRGHRLTAAERHGKHLFIRSGEPRNRWLRLHFGMTGELRIRNRDAGPEPENTRLRLDLEGGTSVDFPCPRKFCEIGRVESPDRSVESRGLGPDPLRNDFDLSDFRDRVDGRRGAVKSTLMNQKVLAGLGNVWTDEALFQVD